MSHETFVAIVNDGGGYDKIALLFFDNTLISTDRFKESDFVQLGGEWVYKEPVKIRSRKTGDYDITLYNYHPFECLQSVAMGDIRDAIKQDINSMV